MLERTHACAYTSYKWLMVEIEIIRNDHEKVHTHTIMGGQLDKFRHLLITKLEKTALAGSNIGKFMTTAEGRVE